MNRMPLELTLTLTLTLNTLPVDFFKGYASLRELF